MEIVRQDIDNEGDLSEVGSRTRKLTGFSDLGGKQPESRMITPSGYRQRFTEKCMHVSVRFKREGDGGSHGW